MAKANKKKPVPKRNYAPKVSLSPLTFDQAVGGFLQVKPDPKPAIATEPSQVKKRGAKK